MAKSTSPPAAALARQCTAAVTKRRAPTAAARLGELEPRVEALVSGQGQICAALRQLDSEYQLLAQDVGLRVEQVQLAAALDRLAVLESRPEIPAKLLHNIQSQVAGFWFALVIAAIGLGVCLFRPTAPLPSDSVLTPLPTPIAFPTLTPNRREKTAKSN